MRSAEYATSAMGRLERLVSAQLEQIETAGRRVAESVAAGRRVWIAQTSHTVHLEGTGRAGGFMAAHVLTDLVAITPGDTVLIGTSAGTWADPVEIALVAKTRGAVVIAMTQLDYERDPRLVADHPTRRRLHECADVVIDLGGPFGDGEQELGPHHVRILPTSGLTAVMALWMVFAAAVDALAEQNMEPLVWESMLLPGAPRRNSDLLAEYHRTGVGYAARRN